MAIKPENKNKLNNLLEAAVEFQANQPTPPPTVSGGKPPTSFEVPSLGRTAPDVGAGGFEEIAPIEIPKSALLEEAEQTTLELLGGDLPEDVIRKIEQTTAEKGIQTGVLGQAGEFSTAELLGLTSLDLTTQGIQSAAALGQLEQQRTTSEADINARVAMSNREIALRYDQLNEETRQWEDKLALSLTEAALGWEQLNLAGAELVSINQRHMQTLVNELIVNNSRTEIAGVQASVDALASFFNTTNEAILALMDIRIQ